MSQAEGNAVFDPAEAFGVVGPCMRRGIEGRTSCEPAHGVHAIDADVHEGASAGDLRIQLPVARFDPLPDFGVGGKDVTESGEFAAANKFLQGDAARLKVLAI